MEVLIGLSLVLAGIVGGAGLIVFYRRRRAERSRRRSEELRALDQRIASRIAGLREGGTAPAAPPPHSDDELADLASPIPALLPLETGPSWLSRLGLRRPSRDVDPAERGTVLRDTAVVLGVGVALLLIASRFLPASTPSPNATATPSGSLVAVLPTGTPNLLNPTPVVTATPAETPSPTPDITFEPTPTPVPTAAPTRRPSGGGGGPNPTPVPTPNPTVKPDSTPPSKPALFGINSLSPTSVTLDWAASSDNVRVTGYNIYRNNVLRGTVTTLSFTDAALTPGTSYTFAARARDAAGNLSIAALQAVTTPPTPPGAPQSLVATAGTGQVTLNWLAPSSDGGSAVTGYEIWRATSLGAETPYDTVGVVLTYTDLAAPTPDTYFYVVKAVNVVGTGPDSNEGSATPT